MKGRELRLLSDPLLAAADRFPGKAAIITEGTEHSYSELAESSLRLAHALRDRGVGRGDRVVVYMENNFETAVALHGILLAGATFSLINPQTKSEKLSFVLNDSAAKCLITQNHLAQTFLPSVDTSASLRSVLCAGGDCAGAGTSVAVEDLQSAIDASEPITGDPGTIPLDLAALIYTSGSTGNPKGVMMTHQAMLFAAGSISEYLRLGSEDRIVNVLPLAFDYGLYQLLMSVRLGATLALERSFTYPADVLRRVADHGVTVFPGVPTVFATLAAMHRRKALSFPAVKRVTNTAAGLPPEFHHTLQQIFPNALIFRMYGLTECKRVCYLEPGALARKPESVGKAIPGTEVFLLSPDGERVGPNTPGILHVRGPHVMAGYWNQPELSREMLTDGPLPGEKILRTGDWFRMDDEGDLYFLGRSDDIIKTRGEKVSPLEVENAIYAVSGVKEVAVIGVPDEILGEAVKAFVVPHEGASISERDVIGHCAKTLENFMVPRSVEFRTALPQTSTGKVSKKELRGR